MNKAQLIDAVADRLGGSRRDANDAVEAVIDTITRTVAGGDRVAITGFGVFEKVDRPARMARNPRTGERVRVKKTAVPRFRAGQGLKDVVSGSRKLPRLSGSRATASASRATASRPAASKTASKPSTTAKATASRGAAKSAPGKSSVRVASKSSGSARTTRKANNTSPARKSPAKRAPKK